MPNKHLTAYISNKRREKTMAKQSKKIRSHAERVRKANEIIHNNPVYSDQPISIVDREAFVECLLLEDIADLYESRLQNEKKRVPHGPGGELSKKLNIEQFTAIRNLFDEATEAAIGAINAGNYKTVWRSIHEGALMMAAKSVKNLPELRAMANQLLQDLEKDTNAAIAEDTGLKDDIKGLKEHTENTRVHYGLFPEEDIADVVRSGQPAITDRKNNSRLDTNY